MDYKDASKLIEKGEINFIDIRFTDLRGVWQHFTITAENFDKDDIEKGYGFDGSSVRGFQNIYDSDLVIIPDTDTLVKDPFSEDTLICIGDVYDPIEKTPYPRCPRNIAKKAEKYLEDSGIGDISYWGPEAEFFVFNRLDYSVGQYFSMIDISSADIGDDPATADGYPLRTKGGYFPVPPFDKLQDFRSEVTMILQSIGIKIEAHHHEVATAGQVEIDMKYDSLVEMADNLMMYKYVVRTLAARYGYTVTFLPKPIFGDNGTGMHVHQSIFKDGKNIFFDKDGYGGLSKDAKSYIAGLLGNIGSVLAITNPTMNSYRRLVPHYEAPTAVAFSRRNRSAAIRIPMYGGGVDEKATRLEFRCPDPTANPYLAFPAMLVSGIEGIKSETDPTKEGFGPFDEDIWEKEDVKQTPRTLFDTLEALKKDEILVKSGVFTKEILESYVEVKMDEIKEASLYPTPADFHFYGDI